MRWWARRISWRPRLSPLRPISIRARICTRWLLTGKTLFDSDNVQELLRQHVKVMPPTPAERVGTLVSPDLEQVIMRCLSKVAEQRFASAAALDEALADCASAGLWSTQEAQRWWQANLTGIDLLPVAKMTEKTLIIAERR